MSRRATVLAAATAALLVAALHALRPDLPPLSSRLSEYANGPFGWVMTAAFLTLAAGLLSLAVAVAGRRTGDGLGRGLGPLVAALALVACMGMVGSAVYRTQGAGAAERRHALASTAAAVALTCGAVVWSLDRSARRPLLPRSLAAMAAALTLASPLLHDTAVTGLGQRLLWAALLAWMVAAVTAPHALDGVHHKPEDWAYPAAPDTPSTKAHHG